MTSHHDTISKQDCVYYNALEIEINGNDILKGVEDAQYMNWYSDGLCNSFHSGLVCIVVQRIFFYGFLRIFNGFLEVWSKIGSKRPYTEGMIKTR